MNKDKYLTIHLIAFILRLIIILCYPGDLRSLELFLIRLEQMTLLCFKIMHQIFVIFLVLFMRYTRILRIIMTEVSKFSFVICFLKITPTGFHI